MPEFFLEVGVEELPASMVESAAKQLLQYVCEGLSEAKLSPGEGEWYATPRRLIAIIPDVLSSQPDEVVEKRGPGVKAAFADGQPTPALLGFCRSAGIEPSQAEVRGEYVYAKAEVKGKSAKEVLAQIIPEALRKIAFDKTMRWGAGRTRFSRPVRWIAAILGGELVPFRFESVESGKRSYGHRFLAPDSFEVDSAKDLLKGLRERFVEPSPQIREKTIREQSSAQTGKALLSDALVFENVYLTEWPQAISGRFRADFLELPRPVLTTAMAKHERFFPVEDEIGKITNEFISIKNSGDDETVRKGNEWVLNARFNDAKFFYDEDSRSSLAEFLEKTSRIVFQEKLGSIRMRADRLSALARGIATEANLPKQEIENCAKAALFAKADLSAGLVSELPSLQGKIGGEYARREGMPDAICHGIFAHYEPAFSPECEGGRAALTVMCADQADKLAGYLGIGEAPSGSSDPFALRKAATMLIDAQIGWDAPKKGIADWVLAAAGEYRKQGISLSENASIMGELRELITGRYSAMFTKIPHDVREAALATDWREPSDAFLERATLLNSLSRDVQFVRTAKRPANIVQAAQKKGIGLGENVDTGLFEHEGEKSLFEAARNYEIPASMAEHAEKLRSLQPKIDAFFDEVMVMVEDERLRNNRLALLASVDVLFRILGDFSKIVVEGE